MKILIIGTARSGTTSLTKGLFESLGESYSVHREPYNKSTRTYWGKTYLYPYVWEDNSIVKMLVDQVPSQDSYPPRTTGFWFNGNHEEYFKEVSEQFDRVILLKRKNYNDTLISYCHAMNETASKGKYRWHSSYKLDKEVDTTPAGRYIERAYEMLDEVQKATRIPFTYYEDIYSGDKSKVDLFIRDNSLPIDNNILHKWLDPRDRYRQN